MLLVVAATISIGFTGPERGSTSGSGCWGSEESRWAEPEFVSAGVFGLAAADPLVGVGGLAYNSTLDQLYVFDAAMPSLVVTDGKLSLLSRRGREGDGPGEFARPASRLEFMRAIPLRDVLAVGAGSEYVVYDHRRLQWFAEDGRLTKDQTLGIPSVLTLGVVGISLLDDGSVLLGQVDGSGGGLVVRTLRADGESFRVVHELEVTPPTEVSTTRVQFSLGPNTPRPVWAARGACLVVGDGSSPFLLRVDIENLKEDTVNLPEVFPPPRPNADRRRALREALEERGFPVGRRAEPSTDQTPRWSALRIDPDGNIWAKPRGIDNRVYRVDTSGSVHEMEIDAFPLEFGEPGVFYSHHIDPESHVPVIARYERIQRR